MKKTLLLTLALLFSAMLFAQNSELYIRESFDSDNIPTNWTFEGNGTNNWMISKSLNAGGEANELLLNWSPTFDGTARMVSPAIDLTNATEAVVSFNAFLDNYENKPSTIGVATTSNNGVTWNTAWEQAYSETELYKINAIVKTSDIGKENVKFCIFYNGFSGNLNGLYFDNIEIFSSNEFNLALKSINVSKIVNAKNNTISFTVKNTGKENITSFKASYQIDNNEVVTQNFVTNIASLQSENISFQDDVTFPVGSHNLTISIFDVNGKEDITTDNVLSSEINVALGSTQRIPMIEHFSSSTCVPCVLINMIALNTTNNHPGKYTYTKYAMNWPSYGDPYFTNDGNIKRNYYNVNSVPSVFLDSEFQVSGNAAQSITQSALLNRYNNVPAIANVRGAFTVEGNTINVIADFMTYFDAENIKAYIAVNEKTTTGNVGNNDETEFHHVMMKMLGDANGNVINTKAGNYQRLQFSYDMSTTFMEDINDLEVALWLQNDVTKEIYNSHFAYEYTSHPYPVRNLNVTKNDNTSQITWDAPEQGNPIGYNIYVNDTLVSEKHNTLSYTINNTSEAMIVKVVAVYENDKTSIEVVNNEAEQSGDEPEQPGDEPEQPGDEPEEPGDEPEQPGDEPEEPGDEPEQPGDEPEQPGDEPEEPGEGVEEFSSSFNIHPNPANDKLYIEILTQTLTVEIYDIFGRQQSTVNSQQSTVIDVSNLNTGIYIIKINTKEGNIVKQFIKQ